MLAADPLDNSSALDSADPLQHVMSTGELGLVVARPDSALGETVTAPAALARVTAETETLALWVDVDRSVVRRLHLEFGS